MALTVALLAVSSALAATLDFSEPPTSPEDAGTSVELVTAADLDGDGDPDLATANFGSNDVTILENVGAGDFTEPATSPEGAGGNPSSVAAADLDGDGDADLAVTNYGSDDVTILLNDGTGDFTQAVTSPEGVGTDPFSVAPADLDGDGDSDLAVANTHSHDVTILLNDGAGDFTQAATSPEGAGSEPFSVAAADVDADGDPDLAVANFSSDDVTVLLNDGAGDFTEPATSPEGAGDASTYVAAADVDGDGNLDLATANAFSNDVTILLGDGAGDFTEPATSPEGAGDGPAAIAAADLDLDGDADLATANSRSNDVTILGNDGAGDFTEPASSPEATGFNGNSIAVADLDGDGAPDLAVGATDVTILLNAAIADRGGEFSCVASALAQGANDIGPIANGYAADSRPCLDDKASAAELRLAGPDGKVIARTLYAETQAEPDDPSAAAPAAGDMGFAHAAVEKVKFVTDTRTVVVRGIRSTANTLCVPDGAGGLTPLQRSTSSVANVTVNGARTPIGKAAVDIPIPGVGTLRLNAPHETYDNGTRRQIVRTAVWLDVGGFANDVHAARSKSDYSYAGAGNPCVLV